MDWQGWQVLDTNILQREINNFLVSSHQLRSGVYIPLKAGTHDVEDLCKALKWVKTHARAQPAWTEDVCPFVDVKEVIACKNGLLDIRTRQLSPHTPQFWSSNVSELDCDPAARAPRFKQFLEELWPGDEQAQLCILEWFGLCLTYITKYQKMLMIKGPRRSGKGDAGTRARGLSREWLCRHANSGVRREVWPRRSVG